MQEEASNMADKDNSVKYPFKKWRVRLSILLFLPACIAIVLDLLFPRYDIIPDRLALIYALAALIMTVIRDGDKELSISEARRAVIAVVLAVIVVLLSSLFVSD